MLRIIICSFLAIFFSAAASAVEPIQVKIMSFNIWYGGDQVNFNRIIEAIKKAGLAKGGSLDNAVVIGMDDIVNPQGLRYRKELVNHKILDLIGDLYTSGYRIMGKVEANKTGHHLNNLLLKELFSDPANYTIY